MKLIDVDVKLLNVPKSGKKVRCWVKQLFYLQPFDTDKIFHFGWNPLDLLSWEAIDEARFSSLYFYRGEHSWRLNISFENRGSSMFVMEPLAACFGIHELSSLSEDEVLGFVEGG